MFSRIHYEFTMVIDLKWLQFWFLEEMPTQNLYIEYISSHQPDFPLFVKFDPISTSDDLWSPELTLNNLEFEFFTKFWVETYVFCIQFD